MPALVLDKSGDHSIVRPHGPVKGVVVFYHGLGGMGGAQNSFLSDLAEHGVLAIVPHAEKMVSHPAGSFKQLVQFLYKEASRETTAPVTASNLTPPPAFYQKPFYWWKDANGFAASLGGWQRLYECLRDTSKGKYWYAFGFTDRLEPDLVRTVENAVVTERKIRPRITELVARHRGDTNVPVNVVGWSMGGVMSALAMTQNPHGLYDGAVVIGAPYLTICPDVPHAPRPIDVVFATRDPLRNILRVEHDDIVTGLNMYGKRFGVPTGLYCPDERHHDLRDGVAEAARGRVLAHVQRAATRALAANAA